jgi:hypothetical protein
LAGRLGRQNWLADLAGRLGQQTLLADLAVRLVKIIKIKDGPKIKNQQFHLKNRLKTRVDLLKPLD